MNEVDTTNRFSTELTKAKKASVNVANLSGPALSNMPFSTDTLRWKSHCVVDLVTEAIENEEVLDTLKLVEDQAATLSQDGEMLFLPCGKRLGECAVILSLNPLGGESVNCLEHTEKF